MAAETVKIDPAHPEAAFFRCREVLASGGTVVYPTDTFYGLGVDPKNPAAVQRLFAIKGRKADQPILLLISEQAAASDWADEVPLPAKRLMQRYWPGPLTLVLRAQAHVSQALTAGTGTIGLRVPGALLTRRLLAYLGTALTGTSANVSGGPSPETSAAAMEAIGDVVDLVLDGGRTPGGRPSTVVDVSAGGPRVLREGAIPSSDILGHVHHDLVKDED